MKLIGTLIFALSIFLSACNPGTVDDRVAELTLEVEQLKAELAQYRNQPPSPLPGQDPDRYSCVEANTKVESLPLKLLVDVDIDDDLLDWYFSMPGAIDRERVNFRDKDLKLFTEKLLEDPEAFLKLATSGLDNPNLLFAIRFALPYAQQDLLLPYIDSNKELANMAYLKNVNRTHPAEFERALYNWPGALAEVPVGLILAALDAESNATSDIIRSYAVSGQKRLAVFEKMAAKESGNIAQLAVEAWQNSSESDAKTRRFETAVIAAKYAGRHDAIMSIAKLYRNVTKDDKKYYEQELGKLVLNIDLRTFPELAENFEYEPESKKWYIPPL